MKTHLPFLLAWLILLSGFLNESRAQEKNYSFVEIGQAEAYQSIGYCRVQNYYWDQGLIDSQGNIYFIFVDNYKLCYFKSEDNGSTWNRTEITTGYEGKVFTAMGALTSDDKLMICYTVNTGFNNGTVSYGQEFLYDSYTALQTTEGWDIRSVRPHSGNSGIIPYGSITTKDGKVHFILQKYGWYNYGGELYELVYNCETKTYEDLVTIKIWNDRPVDYGTFHVCKLSTGNQDSLICIYQRHASDRKYNNLEVVKKGPDGWTEPKIIQANSDYATYNRFDIEDDKHGHGYFAYFEPHGEKGPKLFLGHNQLMDLPMYEPFDVEDTLRKVSIHPYPDGVAYLYLNFKDSLPEIWKYSEDGLEPTGFLPGYNRSQEEDSINVMRFHYQIPLKNNFTNTPGLFSYTNRYQGKEGNTVLSYPILYVSADLEKPASTVGTDIAIEDNFQVYPNPGSGLIHIKGPALISVAVYDLTGSLRHKKKICNSGSINISHLNPGIYLIRAEGGSGVVKYVKQD